MMRVALPSYCTGLWARHLLALTLGALGALAMAPFNFVPALVVALSGFWGIFTSLNQRAVFQSALSGFLFSFGFFIASLWWIGNALLVGGNPFAWALPFAVAGLPALLALFPMVFLMISRWVAPGRSLPAYLFFLACLSFSEWARGHWFTGFPWNFFAMAWSNNLNILQILSIGGEYTLSALTLLFCTAPAFAVLGHTRGKAPRLAPLILSVLAMTGVALYGSNRLSTTPTTYDTNTIIQVVQPNIPQDEKWDSAKYWDNYLKTMGMLTPEKQGTPLSGKVRVLILPESAITYHALNEDGGLQAIRNVLKLYSEKTYLLTGALLHSTSPNGQDEYHNSLIAMNQAAQVVNSFDKFHLVPFGEYIPFQKYIPFGPLVNLSGFVEGPGPRTIELEDVPSYSPLVCYEVIFPGEVTAPSNRPHWLVNVTNDAWYGISPGPYQHMNQALFRSIEEGLPTARSANTGFSVIIDPLGRILRKTEIFQDSVIESALPNRLESPPPYTFLKETLYFIIIVLCILPIMVKIKRTNFNKTLRT